MAKGKYEYWLTEDGLTLLRGWARDGLADEQIAENMGITCRTLYRWKDEYCQICQALKKSKAIYDNEVVDSLKDRTKGYFWTERKVEMDGDGNVTKITETTKHVPADVTAIIFWLKNRMRKDWKDRPDDEVNEALLSKATDLLGIVGTAIDRK